METRNFEWMLQELETRKAKFRTLDTILCSGENITRWYANDADGSFKHRSFESSMHIKHLLNYLLEVISPRMSEHNPSKLICFVYCDKKMRAFTSKDIIELPASRVYSMRIRSIHVVRGTCRAVYRVISGYKFEDVHCSIKKVYSKGAEGNKEMAKQALKEFTIGIYEYINKSSSVSLHHFAYDALLTEQGEIFLLRTNKIKLRIGFQSDSNSSYLPSIPTRSRGKHKPSVKFVLGNSNQSPFLEMMAKTIKNGKKCMSATEKTTSHPQPRKRTADYPRQPLSPAKNKQSQKFTLLQYYRDSISSKVTQFKLQSELRKSTNKRTINNL